MKKGSVSYTRKLNNKNLGQIEIGVWCNGNTTVFGTVTGGSIPSIPVFFISHFSTQQASKSVPDIHRDDPLHPCFFISHFQHNRLRNPFPISIGTIPSIPVLLFLFFCLIYESFWHKILPLFLISFVFKVVGRLVYTCY